MLFKLKLNLASTLVAIKLGFRFWVTLDLANNVRTQTWKINLPNLSLVCSKSFFFGSVPVPSLMACCGNTMLDFASNIHASLNCALTFVNQVIPTLAVPKPAKPQQLTCCLFRVTYVLMWKAINPYCAILIFA